MANTFAYFVMGVWPLVILLMFQQRRGRERVARTTAWAMLLGMMFLPASLSFDAPLIPPLDKCRLTALTVRLALHLFHPRELLKRAPGHRLAQVITTLLIGVAVMTTMTNRDPLQFGAVEINAMVPGDILSLAISVILDVYVPFTIGQRVFTSELALRDLFDVMARCLLLYTPFILYELRMAPVLHDTFYGYSPFSFLQGIRGGGYRPSVFMSHGLTLAMFVMAIYGSARGLWASNVPTKPLSANRLVLLFMVILLLCKTLAATLYALCLWLLVRKPLRRKPVIIFLWAISFGVATYPAARIEGIFPTYLLVDWAASASEDRAESLDFRFRNEDLLLARGLERPWWGWGIWGRGRVYDEDGNDVSITDGLWVMWFGAVGHAGLSLHLAMICLPLLRAARRLKKMRPSGAPMVAALAIVSACLAVDILPNSRSDYLAVLLSGVLWTMSEMLTRPPRKKPPIARKKPEPDTQIAPEPAPAPVPV